MFLLDVFYFSPVKNGSFRLDSYENYNLIIRKVVTVLVTMKKDTRDGRRERSAHNIVPPLPHTTITYLDYCKKGGGDCRKEERLRSFDTKVRCTADVSSLPSINNVIVIRKPRKFHSSIQNLAASFKKKN